MTPLTLGVEEEFLLVDPCTGETTPRAAEVLSTAENTRADVFSGAWQSELLRTQVEVSSGVCEGLTDLREEITESRKTLAAAAHQHGLALLAAGRPPFGGQHPPITDNRRYHRTAEALGELARDYESCGCHVHVGPVDPDTAVEVVNRVRPWLPVLLNISGNSPYHRGEDTGYQSWRYIEQSRFPDFGFPPYFLTAEAYNRRVRQLVDCGVLVDEGMCFWLMRPSPHAPTVEFRVADTAPTVDEALLQAALSRALVAQALRTIERGVPNAEIDDHMARVALWTAARDGLGGTTVDPVDQRMLPSAQRVRELVDHVSPALLDTGDDEFVTKALNWLHSAGTGAQRQRSTARRGAAAGLSPLVE